jgi:SAM-dependent methyltransferase
MLKADEFPAMSYLYALTNVFARDIFVFANIFSDFVFEESVMAEQILESVKAKYGAVAESSLSSDHAGVKAVAEAFGYSPEELTSIPAEANMGLSCGNPTATAHIRPGEVVVDLGSGGGLDVFLASKMVGPEGRAIGIDMTPAMIERARVNARTGGYTNVEFYLSTIDQIPLPDSSVDCVISNCVLNLAPDKPAVFREIARVLKPGGRVAVSDIALKQELPESVAKSVAAYVGCIAGAILIDDYKAGLLAAGFEHVEVVDSGKDLNAYAKVENQSGCCSSKMETANPFQVIEAPCCTPAPNTSAPLHEELKTLLSQYDINAAAASVKVYAIKPGIKSGVAAPKPCCGPACCS